MKKLYKVVLLIILLITLTTYNYNKTNSNTKLKSHIFNIKNIEIDNNLLIQKEKIKSSLEDIYNQNIFLIKGQKIKESLKKINFIKNVEVRKKYPNTIIIKIFETKPVAIFFKDKKKYFLDTLSNLIPYDKNIFNKPLPIIIGDNGDKDFIIFLNQLNSKKFPSKEVIKFYYFKIGRWDVHFLDSKIIKFPSNNINLAIDKSIELLNRENLKNYNIIDLRIGGKIIVE